MPSTDIKDYWRRSWGIGDRKRVGKPGGVVEPGIEYYGTSKFKTETHIYPGGNAHSNWWSDKPGKNQHKISLKDIKVKEKVKKFIIDNPDMNQKEGSKILGRRQAKLVPADQWQNPGKKYDDVKAKARRDADKKWFNKYSKPYIEDRTRGTMDIHKHHAGGLREKVTTENTMPLEARLNYKDIRKFEDAIDIIQNKQYKNNLNKNISTDEKKKIFELLNKEEAALRKANPEFSKYKSTLVFKESALSKTGFMHNEVMVAPELTYSEGKTGQKIAYKGATEKETKKIIEITKKGNTTAIGNLFKKVGINLTGDQKLKAKNFLRSALNKGQNISKYIPFKTLRKPGMAGVAALDYALFHYVFDIPASEAILGASGWLTNNRPVSNAILAQTQSLSFMNEIAAEKAEKDKIENALAAHRLKKSQETAKDINLNFELEEKAAGGLSGVDQYIINRGL